MQTPRFQLREFSHRGPAPRWPLCLTSPGKCGGSGCRQPSWRFSYPIDTGTHVCSLHTLPKGRVFSKPVLGPRGPPAWEAPAPRRNARRHSSRGPEASPLLGCSGRDAQCWGPHTHSRPRSLAPAASVAGLRRKRGPLSLHGVRPPGRSRSAGAPTSAQVFSPRQQRQQQVAARRLPARDQLPARLHGSRRQPPRLSGPELSRGSARPRPQWPRAGVCTTPGAAGRCARGPPRGPEPRAARRRSGGGAGPRRGAGPGSRRRAAGVRGLCAPLPGELRCGETAPSARPRDRDAQGRSRVSAAR